MLSSRPLQVPLNDDASSSNFAYARTPAKALLKHRSGALRENAVYHGSMTVKAKGKSVLHTPFNHARKAPQTAVKAKGMATPSIHVSRPLGDKTPFPNRQQLPAQQLRTPKPQATKLLLEIDDAGTKMLTQTPECLLLPSATRRRKSLRLPSAISKNLKTPATKGNHWDVSDGDVDLGAEDGDIDDGSSRAKTAGVDVQASETSDDEIEYMPPKLPEQPWAPPFDMPDYKELGRALLRVAHGERIDESMDVFYAQDIELQIDSGELLRDSGAFDIVGLSLSVLEDDDPFSAAMRNDTLVRSPDSSNGPRATSVASTSRTNSRPGTALARPGSQSSSHSRTAMAPAPAVVAPRPRDPLFGRSTTAAARLFTGSTASKAQASKTAVSIRSTTHPTSSTINPKAPPPKMAAPAAAPRRVQSTKAATSRSMESTSSIRAAPRSATTKAMPTTRGPSTRPTTAGTKIVQGTSSTGSRYAATKPSTPNTVGSSSTSEQWLEEICEPGLFVTETEYLFDIQ